MTVLAALKRRLPDHGFLYLGDHRHQPYGEREGQEVHALTRAGVARLFAAGCRLVILACNTAAAVALRRLQREWLPHAAPACRVLGVHIPLVEALTGHAWRPPEEHVSPAQAPPRVGEAVVIFATPTTIASRAFTREISRHDPSLAVIEQACPGLAAAIERHRPQPVLATLVARAWKEAARKARSRGWTITRAALACTHYPLIADLFREILPNTISLLDQPALVADSLARYLARHPEYAERPQGRETMLYTTADEPITPPGGFSHTQIRFLPWPDRICA